MAKKVADNSNGVTILSFSLQGAILLLIFFYFSLIGGWGVVEVGLYLLSSHINHTASFI